MVKLSRRLMEMAVWSGTTRSMQLLSIKRFSRSAGAQCWPPNVELSGSGPWSKQCSPLVKHDTQQAGDDTHLTYMLIRMRQTKVHQTFPFRPACIYIY